MHFLQTVKKVDEMPHNALFANSIASTFANSVDEMPHNALFANSEELDEMPHNALFANSEKVDEIIMHFLQTVKN